MSQGRYRLGRWLVIASLLGWVDLARAGSASEAGAEPSSAKAAAPSEPGLPPGGDAHEQARVHLAEGNRLFRAADYDGAVREYRAAHELVPSAKLHFNIGLAEKMRGNPVQAARELDQFLADASTVDPGLRADASRYLDELAGMVATVNVHLSHPSLVTIDGAPIESPAVQRPLRLTPGRHDIAVRRVAAPAVVWGRALELVAGTPLTVVPELETPIAPIAGASSTSSSTLSSTSLTSSSPEAEPAPAAGATPIYRRWWFWVAIAGVAGAGLTATAIWAGHNNDGCALQSNCVALVKGAP